MPSWVDATTVAFLDSKLGPADEELDAEETLAIDDVELELELLEVELKLEALDTELKLDALATNVELESAELEDTKPTELAELVTTESKELEMEDEAALDNVELAVDVVLETGDVGELDATDATELDEGGFSDCEGPLLFPPPHATKLHKATLYTIARALWRRHKLLDINMNDSKLL